MQTQADNEAMLAGETCEMESDAIQNGSVLGEDEGVDDFCRLDCDRIAFNS